MDLVLDTLNTRVLVAARSELDRTWERAHGYDPYARLYFIESGNAFVEHHGRRYEMRPGWLYLIPAQTELRFGCPERVIICWTHFTATVLGGMDLFAYLACEYELHPSSACRVGDLMEQLRKTLAQPHPGRPLACSGLLLQVLALFVGTVDEKEQGRRREQLVRFKEVLAHIEAHLVEPCRISRLAKLAHLEVTHFSTTFAKVFGVPPSRYVLIRRIELAQRFLLDTDRTLAAIAHLTGFSDAFHLSKTFKKIVGMPPATFRQHAGRQLP